MRVVPAAGVREALLEIRLWLFVACESNKLGPATCEGHAVVVVAADDRTLLRARGT